MTIVGAFSSLVRKDAEAYSQTSERLHENFDEREMGRKFGDVLTELEPPFSVSASTDATNAEATIDPRRDNRRAVGLEVLLSKDDGALTNVAREAGADHLSRREPRNADEQAPVPRFGTEHATAADPSAKHCIPSAAMSRTDAWRSTMQERAARIFDEPSIQNGGGADLAPENKHRRQISAHVVGRNSEEQPSPDVYSVKRDIESGTTNQQDDVAVAPTVATVAARMPASPPGAGVDPELSGAPSRRESDIPGSRASARYEPERLAHGAQFLQPSNARRSAIDQNAQLADGWSREVGKTVPSASPALPAPASVASERSEQAMAESFERRNSDFAAASAFSGSAFMSGRNPNAARDRPGSAQVVEASPIVDPTKLSHAAAEPHFVNVSATRSAHGGLDPAQDVKLAIIDHQTHLPPVEATSTSIAHIGDVLAAQAETMSAAASPIGDDRPTPYWSSVDMSKRFAVVRNLDLQLEPEDLGAITVRLRLTGGRLDVAINATEPGAEKLLHDEETHLAHRLRSAGYVLDRLAIGGAGGAFDAPMQSGPVHAAISDGGAGADAHAGAGSDGGGRRERFMERQNDNERHPVERSSYEAGGAEGFYL